MSTMTVGELSRRTRVPARKLREYTDRGWIYSRGRSSAGYRVFDDDAFWCVQAITTMRSLGLTEAEIERLAHCTDAHLGRCLATLLETARDRTQAHIDQLSQRLQRIDAFEGTHRDVLTGRSEHAPWDPDPRASS